MRETKLARKPVFICHDLTPLTRTYLIDDLADVVIDQNARLTAEQSVIQLLGSIASSAPVIANRYHRAEADLSREYPGAVTAGWLASARSHVAQTAR